MKWAATNCLGITGDIIVTCFLTCFTAVISPTMIPCRIFLKKDKVIRHTLQAMSSYKKVCTDVEMHVVMPAAPHQEIKAEEIKNMLKHFIRHRKIMAIYSCLQNLKKNFCLSSIKSYHYRDYQSFFLLSLLLIVNGYKFALS
jgi:hypothetical protein